MTSAKHLRERNPHLWVDAHGISIEPGKKIVAFGGSEKVEYMSAAEHDACYSEMMKDVEKLLNALEDISTEKLSKDYRYCVKKAEDALKSWNERHETR